MPVKSIMNAKVRTSYHFHDVMKYSVLLFPQSLKNIKTLFGSQVIKMPGVRLA